MSSLVRTLGVVLLVAALVAGIFHHKEAARLFGKAETAPATKKSETEHVHQADGTVVLSDAKVAAAGIELLSAGAATLRDGLALHGIIQPNHEMLAQVTPRFPGVVRDIKRRIGDVVPKGDLLAVVESNQSLTPYELRASMAGTVVDRQISLGEFVSEQKPAFVVADLSSIWVDFSVYRRDLARVRAGDKIAIDVEDGGAPVQTALTYLSPVGSSETQSVLARAIVANADGRFRPGMFVRGRVLLAEKPVALAVKLTALQMLENRAVVFVRSNDKFEARDVLVGARDAEWAEITFGLAEGDVYAAANSFVIKAELAKGTAAHEH